MKCNKEIIFKLLFDFKISISLALATAVKDKWAQRVWVSKSNISYLTYCIDWKTNIFEEYLNSI